jgi:hypothetical protein
MASTQPTSLVALVRDLLADPAAGRRSLPRLLATLDAEDPLDRLLAGWACCLVSRGAPDVVPYLADRVVARTAAGRGSTEAVLVARYLAATYPDDLAAAVERRAGEVGEAADAYRERYQRALSTGEYALPPSMLEDDAVRMADVEEGEGSGGGAGEGTPGGGPGGGRRTERERAREQARGGSGSDRPTLTPADRQRLARVLADETQFDEFEVIEPIRSLRYADGCKLLATAGSRQQAIALRLSRVPGSADPAAFRAGFERAVERWAAVGDHDHLMAVHDWGSQPTPWVATDCPNERLRDRGSMSVAEVCWNAEALAGALARLHGAGVVHGGVDPYNVVYVSTMRDERPTPLLTNCGLPAVYREQAPGPWADPRYLAPECVSDDYGTPDHASDVYGLGMVLYTLFTRRAPFPADADLPSAVLESDPPAPTAVNDSLPTAVDRVVRKATARRKVERYETVEDLERDLRSVTEAFG